MSFGLWLRAKARGVAGLGGGKDWVPQRLNVVHPPQVFMIEYLTKKGKEGEVIVQYFTRVKLICSDRSQKLRVRFILG